MKTMMFIFVGVLIGMGADASARANEPEPWNARFFGWSHNPEKVNQGRSNDLPDRETVPADQSDPKNWYVRLTAEVSARGLTTENTQIGQLDRSDARSEDLEALAPFGASYLDIVVFEEDNAKRALKGSFHPYTEGSADHWRFTVKTDDAGSNVILSWRGLYTLTTYVDEYGRRRYREGLVQRHPLLSKMQIVDEVTGETVPVIREEGRSFIVFNMEGSKEHTFRWELLEHESEATDTGVSDLNVKYARSLFRRYESAAPKHFDLDRPPVERENGPKPFK